MSADEAAILQYLKFRPEEFVSIKELSRQVGGKHRFREEPFWARPVLTAMMGRGLLEANAWNQFRVKPTPTEKKQFKFRVPHNIALLLIRSGKDFSQLVGRV